MFLYKTIINNNINKKINQCKLIFNKLASKENNKIVDNRTRFKLQMFCNNLLTKIKNCVTTS